MDEHPMKPPLSCPVESSAAPLPPGIEQRTRPDRRERPTSPWDALPPAGHRMRCRRAQEHCRPYFVDRFSPALLAFILMLLIATFVDAVLTIRLIEAGGGEINPVMNRLLERGIMPFLLGKYLLTVIGLPVLLIFKNHYLFGTRLRVGHLIPLIVALYAVLIGYQLVLMNRCPGL
jgi:hypothetical protein